MRAAENGRSGHKNYPRLLGGFRGRREERKTIQSSARGCAAREANRGASKREHEKRVTYATREERAARLMGASGCFAKKAALCALRANELSSGKNPRL